MGDDDASYLLTNSELETADRFAGLESVFDPVTRGHLTRLGLPPGARCLEVGAGSGSIARWMADEVGPAGRVLAVDLDPRWCRRDGRRAARGGAPSTSRTQPSRPVRGT